MNPKPLCRLHTVIKEVDNRIFALLTDILNKQLAIATHCYCSRNISTQQTGQTNHILELQVLTIFGKITLFIKINRRRASLVWVRPLKKILR